MEADRQTTVAKQFRRPWQNNLDDRGKTIYLPHLKGGAIIRIGNERHQIYALCVHLPPNADSFEQHTPT